MKRFKVVFPAGYNIENYSNDNIDLNIYVPEGILYSATAFTLENIQHLMQKNNYKYFWSSDIFIVENLMIQTLLNAIEEIFKESYENIIFNSIGTISKVYGKDKYEEVVGYENI